MSPLDEKALRKPEWNEATGQWLTLADGQSWLFPKPVVRLKPKRVEGKITLSSSVSSFGPDFDAKVKALDDENDFVVAVFELADDLFARNYDLSEDDRLELLAWNPQPDPETGDPFLGAIVAIARGTNAPKLSTAGSDSPSSS